MAGDGETANDGDTSAAGETATGLTEVRVIELIKKVAGEAFNKAIGSRLTAFESKQTKSFETLQETVIAKVGESIGELLGSKLEEMGVKPQADKAAKGGSVDEDAIKNSPFVKTLIKKQEASDAVAKKLLDERDAERKEVREGKLKASLLTELTAKGLDPKRVSDAADLLLLRKRVRYESDESDSIQFTDAKGEAVDLESGVGEWAASEDGKLYLPPSGASGSGNPPERAKQPNSTNGVPNRDQLKGQLFRAYNGETT